jgi:opacity protein-like surface antigen
MRLWIATVSLFFGTAAMGSAQVAEVAVTGGWGVFTDSTLGGIGGFGDPESELKFNNGLRIGGRLSMNRWFLGHEISYAWQKTNLKTASEDIGGVSIHNYYYNFVVHATPEGTAIRPFVTGGAGFSTFFPPGVSSLSGSGDNKFGFNYGGGVKFRLTDKFGLRMDVRDHLTGRPFEKFGVNTLDGKFHNVEFSVGFALLL